MKNQINLNNLISISLLSLASFTILFTYLTENGEFGLAISQISEESNQITTQQGTDTKKIVQQGVVTSSPDPLPGHEAHQSITILRLKGDNTIYEGTLSFIASKPVEVQILYRNITSDDTPTTIPQIAPKFGKMSIIPLPGNQGSVISSLVQPQYPEGATSFSASIPFTGNGLALHNLDGDEFVAAYTVTADQVGQAERADNIVNPSPPADDGDDEDDDDKDDDDDD
jgi:hypothetical protein